MPMAPHLAALCLELGLPVELILARGLPPVAEPDELLVAEVRADGVPQLLPPTPAFAWLARHAAGFGFVLSYPPGNPQGFEHEPWHWYFRGQPNVDAAVA